MPILILGLLGFTVFTVIARTVSLFSLVTWLIAIVLTARIFWHPSDHREKVLQKTDLVFLLIIGFVGLALLAYFSSIPSHYHQDEFITAYTSLSLPPMTKIDWFSAYPPVWVSQFPILFHILQKPFFALFGPSVWAVRISVWPYYLGILFFLYLLAKRIFSGSEKIVALLFVFFAPMLYLSSTGLHFISSTFFFIASLYFLIAYDAVLLGLFTALSYLTYPSSYVTIPIVILATIPKLNKLIPTFLIFLIILLPFIAYAGFVNNFFVQRIDQVNALSGSWSDLPEKMKHGQSVVSLVFNQTENAFRSLIQPGIAGLGGYNFGKLALFEPIGFVLFILGFRFLKFFPIVLAIVFPFITNFILSTQPPAFHRISLLYPLFTLSMGIALAKQKRCVLIPIIIIFALSNFKHVRTMIDRDATLYPQNSRLVAEYILKNVPQGSTVSIAAFPSFHLQQELVFRTNNTYVLNTEETQAILTKYHGETLILLNPTPITLKTLLKAYPNYRAINILENTTLGDLVLFTQGV